MSSQAEQNFQAFGNAGARPIWYHGKCARLSVEGLLKGKPEGSFMIRDSSSSAGDYVLSMSESNRVSHYIIQRSGPHSFVLSDKTFINLVELINFYRIHLLDVSCLTVPLPEKEALRNGVRINHFLITVRAKHNFNGRDPEDLSFRKGEMLNVVEKHEPQWWKAQSQDTLQVGVIPSNYVDQYALGPIEIAKKEAAEAAKKRAEYESQASAKPPPVTRRAAPAVPQGPSKEELQRQEDARFEREEQERQEANARAEAKHAAEVAAVEKQQAAIAKAEAGAARAAQVHAARPKFIMAEASLDRAANTFDKSALTFKEGDMIHVKKQNENGLWEGSVVDGRRKGKRGHFPFTFVELVDSGEYNDDIKAIEKEFKIAELKKAGIDINNLLKIGEKLPPIAARQRKIFADAAPDPGGGGAPPPIASRATKPAVPSRGPAPALPPARPTRGAAPPIPQAAEEELYEDGDDETLYGEIDEDDIYGGTAEQFDDSKLDAMMEDIYGVV